MSEKTHYKTLAQQGTFLHKEKASKHYGFAFHVESEEQVKTELNALKKKYFDATHHCYAYVLGIDKIQTRAFDDGEPNNTAGMPILGQIQALALTQTLVVVVRYFGGTKLGTGGLMQAYKQTAKGALLDATIVEKPIMVHYQIQVPYTLLSEVLGIIRQAQGEIIEADYQDPCLLRFAMARFSVQTVLDKLILLGIKY
jgi:uncharacterized YigZ family protein